MKKVETRAPAIAAEPTFTADGQGMLRRDASIHVLHLQDSDEDMARQHAELLGAEIRQGGLPFMARYLGLQVHDRSSVGAHLTSRLYELGLNLMCLAIARNMPPDHRRVFHLLAESAGVSSRTADLAVGMPDSLLILMGLFDRLLRRGIVLPSLRRRPMGFGCSGAVALPEITADGHLLHGRNMDYDGLGYLDRCPAVAFCRPREGRPFVWIASAGVHTGALTSMNEAGLFLGANTAPTTDTSVRGAPFFSVNEEAIRKATTLGEAIDLMTSLRPASGYNVHLSHGPSGEAAVVEYAHSQHRVRTPENGFVVSTNHYVHPDMAATTPRLSLVDSINTHSRYRRLTEILESEAGHVTPDTLMAALGDQQEPFSQDERPLGDVVGNYLNLTSVVADVTTGRFWASADVAPAALGRRVLFDLHRELDAFGQARAYPLEVTPPRLPHGDPTLHAICAYKRAHVALYHRRDPSQALALLKQARERAPTEPRITLSLALVALRLNLLDQAADYGRQYLRLTPPRDPRRYRAHLVQAWAADLNKRWQEARDHYQAALKENPDTDTSELEIRLWRKRRFTHKDRRRMHIDLFNGNRMIL